MEATIERSRGPAKVTPMLAQYLSVKGQVGDAVLFFRLGEYLLVDYLGRRRKKV